ncbi:MAG: hypothetical protein ABI988_10960, partial [Nitrospirota bacterium]
MFTRANVLFHLFAQRHSNDLPFFSMAVSFHQALAGANDKFKKNNLSRRRAILRNYPTVDPPVL